MKAEPLPLVVGLPGTELGEAEHAMLGQVHPAGVILFARNLESPDQTRGLVEQLHELNPEPFICVDLEGGLVNRLEPFWGELPSPQRAAAAGRRAVRTLGEAAGAACRALGIHLDLAPVVDLARPDGLIARQGRALAEDPGRVAVLAEVFVNGLGTWSVSGCLKHFPGIGAVPVDTHETLPVLDLDEAGLEPHIAAFAELSATVPLVMMGHVVVPALGDGELPASLAPSVVERAASLPGSPVILSDDLEMGALAGFGSLPELAAAALRARSHGVLVCSRFDELPAIARQLVDEHGDDSAVRNRVREGLSRLGTLRRDLCRKTAAVPAPDDDTVAQLWEQARREAGV